MTDNMIDDVVDALTTICKDAQMREAIASQINARTDSNDDQHLGALLNWRESLLQHEVEKKGFGSKC